MPPTEKIYDEVSPLSSSESESEDEDQARTSTSARRDQEVLREEDERENLLLKHRDDGDASEQQEGFLGRTFKSHKKKRRKEEGGRKRGVGKKGEEGEDGELMFEMEEGGPQSEISSQASMSSSELDKMNLATRRPTKVRSSLCDGSPKTAPLPIHCLPAPIYKTS